MKTRGREWRVTVFPRCRHSRCRPTRRSGTKSTKGERKVLPMFATKHLGRLDSTSLCISLDNCETEIVIDKTSKYLVFQRYDFTSFYSLFLLSALVAEVIALTARLFWDIPSSKEKKQFGKLFILLIDCPNKGEQRKDSRTSCCLVRGSGHRSYRRMSWEESQGSQRKGLRATSRLRTPVR